MKKRDIHLNKVPAPSWFDSNRCSGDTFIERAVAFTRVMAEINRVVVLTVTDKGVLYLSSIPEESKE